MVVIKLKAQGIVELLCANGKIDMSCFPCSVSRSRMIRGEVPHLCPGFFSFTFAAGLFTLLLSLIAAQ